MRIIAGAKKGSKLVAPEGWDTRPTSDRVRESIFNILDNRLENGLYDKRVADLFAGTGAMGLEALSRGAKEILFVENNARSLQSLKINISKVDTGRNTHILSADLTRPVSPGRAFHVLFFDPPYHKSLVEKSIDHAMKAGWIASGSWLVIETGASEIINLPNQIIIDDERKFGKTRVIFARAQ